MKRVLSIIGVFALVTACSSGGSGPSSSIPAQTSSSQSAPQAVGSTTLTIKFPTNFIRAKASAVTKSKHAQYVNPTTTNYLDVYVDQHLVLLGGGPTYDTVQINTSNGDGTQTINIPLYSTGNNDIVVAERDSGLNPSSNPGNLLAIGQTNGNVSAGNQNQTSVELTMNLYGFAYSTNGTSADLLSGGQTIALGEYPGLSSPFYILPVDADYGTTNIAAPAGAAGGLAYPQVSTYPYLGGTPSPSNLAQNQVGEYEVNYDNNGDEVQVYIYAQNPAYYTWYYDLSSADKAVLPSYVYGPGSSGVNINISVCPLEFCG